MAVYFVYRCGYLSPTYLYRRCFEEDATVLDWFRRHWRYLPEEEVGDHVANLLGVDVAYFGGVFSPLDGDMAPPPESMEDVAAAVTGTYYNAILYEDHCLQVLTDDDEIDMAYFFFDDVFLERHPDLTAYVLLEDWRLPEGEGQSGWEPSESVESIADLPRAEGPGTLYVSYLDLHSGEHLGELNGVVALEGLRVGEVCRWLMRMDADAADDRGWYFSELRKALFEYAQIDDNEEGGFLRALREDPKDDLTWSAYGDWLEERGLRSPGHRLLEWALPHVFATGGDHHEPNKLVQVGEHVMQLFADAGGDDFEHWFFFDDLWGAAHPVLADALIRYASRWDVLTTGDEKRYD